MAAGPQRKRLAHAVGLLYRTLATLGALLVLYAVSAVLRQDGLSPAPRGLLLTVAGLALALALAVWSGRPAAISTQIVALSALATIYAWEYSRVDPVDRMFHVEEFWRFVQSKAARGPVTVQYGSANFSRNPGDGLVLPSGERAFPLAAGVANLPTVMCREGDRPYAVYEADERGFNNPRGLWGKPIDLVFVGDSMTYGACLANSDHFIATIRARHPATLNLGIGGVGPLIELAIVRELVARVRPRYVFYVYDENNDLYFVRQDGDADLVLEYRHPILRKYLEDDRFTQHAYERHPEFDAALRQLVQPSIAAQMERRRPLDSLLRFLGLPLTLGGLAPSPAKRATGPRAAEPGAAEPHYLEVFERILVKMVRVARDAGARFVFVNIPAQPTLCDGVEHPWKRRVPDVVARVGVDFIDLEQDFRNADRVLGRTKLFAVPPCGGHFSELGYKVIGDRLVQYLDLQPIVAQGSAAGAAAPPLAEGWSRPPLSGDPGRHRLVYVGVPLSSTSPEAPPVEARPAPGPGALARAWVRVQLWGIRRLARTRVFHYEQVYQAHAHTSRVIDLHGNGTTDLEGAAIMGYSWQPKARRNLVRVRASVPVWSQSPNSVVTTLFVNSRFAASASQALGAGRESAATLEYELLAPSTDALDVSIRVGPGRPGAVFLNSNDQGPATDMTRPRLTIDEYRVPWF